MLNLVDLSLVLIDAKNDKSISTAEYLDLAFKLAIAERLDGILTEMKNAIKVETRTQIVPSEAVLEALEKIHESSHDNPKVGLSAPTA